MLQVPVSKVEEYPDSAENWCSFCTYQQWASELHYADHHGFKALCLDPWPWVLQTAYYGYGQHYMEAFDWTLITQTLCLLTCTSYRLTIKYIIQLFIGKFHASSVMNLEQKPWNRQSNMMFHEFSICRNHYRLTVQTVFFLTSGKNDTQPIYNWFPSAEGTWIAMFVFLCQLVECTKFDRSFHPGVTMGFRSPTELLGETTLVLYNSLQFVHPPLWLHWISLSSHWNLIQPRKPRNI